MQAKEVYLRGLYLSISCDIEYMLVDIIAKCIIDEPSQRESFKVRYFGNNSMGKKIVKAKESLKKYNENYYHEFKDCFKTIDNLLERRNMFSHSKIEGDILEQDKTVLTFNYIDKGVRIIDTKKIDPLFTELLTYRTGIMRLVELVLILTKERGAE